MSFGALDLFTKANDTEHILVDVSVSELNI